MEQKFYFSYRGMVWYFSCHIFLCIWYVHSCYVKVPSEEVKCEAIFSVISQSTAEVEFQSESLKTTI